MWIVVFGEEAYGPFATEDECYVFAARFSQEPNDWTPLLEKYVDYEEFSFTADGTSTGAITIRVQAKTGYLATLNAYVTNGSAAAGAGDLTVDRVYLAIYADHLNAGAGGFVIF